jgi:hypothetical protein
MDTSVHPRVAGYTREEFIEDKQILMERSRVMRDQGEGALMEQMIDSYKRAKPGEAMSERSEQ